jgi:urate oxidase
VSSIDAKQRQLSALQEACSEAVLVYTQQAQGYLAELSSMQQLLTQLGKCILEEQPAIDQVRFWVSK